MILLQQNYEFELFCTILCQNMVARQRHLGLVPPAVECGQCVLAEATFSCEHKKCYLMVQTITASAFDF